MTDHLPDEREFATYWSEVDADLAAVAARPTIDPLPAMSTDDFTCYTVRITSIGPVRLFGYLSVPTGAGPFPGLLQLPRYGSVNNPPHYQDRLRYLIFTVMHRGQRLADETVVADYPGLLTENIHDQRRYAYRGIAADCLRAAEFLTGRAELDPNRVAVVGDDLALITASRRGGFTVAKIFDQLLHRGLERAAGGTEYPLEEFNDYLRAHPSRRTAVERTLAFFDPVRHVSEFSPHRTLVIDPMDDADPLLSALPGQVDTYARTDADGVDNDFVDSWLAERLDVAASSKFLAAAIEE